MRLNRRPDKLELDAIAEKLDAWRGTDEEVLVDIRRKQNDPNDFRQTMAFGIENRALQYLLLLALRELVDLHPSQYGLRGTHEAITAVAKAMSQGYSWAIECDVRDCFSSFDGRKTLNLLPVPERVGEKVLISEHLNLVAGPTLDYLFGCEDDDEWWPNLLDDELAKARRGIPQGSAVSPLIAEALLASAIRMVPETGVIVAFADNILLLAKSKEDVVSMTNGLRCALKAHPAGPLQPKLKYFHAGQPVEFLGHKLMVKTKAAMSRPTSLHPINAIETATNIAAATIVPWPCAKPFPSIDG